jgi:anti-anti-sigma regulatory factor
MLPSVSMALESECVVETQEALRGGNHVCYVAAQSTISAEFLSAFARRGLAKRQRVMWLVDERADGPLARQVAGGDGAAFDAVAMSVQGAEETYLDGGAFDADRMLELYRSAVAASLAAGYTGLRVLADTTWLAERPAMFERFVDYERRVNDLFADGRFAAVCHYDPQRLPSAWLEAIAGAHPLHADPRSSALTAGPCRVVATERGYIAVSGEVDCSNAASVVAALGELEPADGDFHVDLSGLGFSDVAGTRALVSTARALGRDRRLVVHGGPRSLQVVLATTGWAATPELVLADAEPRGGQA